MEYKQDCMSAKGEEMVTNRERIISVEELEPFNNEYVYDLVMENSDEPYFFANGILVHNSCYFSMENIVGNSIDDAIQCADAVASHVNDSFPEFMRTAFLCQPEHDSLIKVNREVVATAGIFRAKKKYILHVADMEGKRLNKDDPKSLKSQGSDIKISSTPEVIRTLLKDVTMMILQGEDKLKVDNHIINFRRNLNRNPNINPLDYASVTSVNNIDEYLMKWERIEKPGIGNAKIPANVRSSLNHNWFIKQLNITEAQAITSGSKIKMIWLKPNEHGYLNMAFSSDTIELPKWFTDNFEVDVKLTEQKLVDQKLKNIFDPIGWSVPTEQTLVVGKLLKF